MFIPHSIKQELKKLGSSTKPLENLRSLHVLGEWISDMKVFVTEHARRDGHTLEEIGNVDARPRQAVHRSMKTARVAGLTDPDFNGVSSATLRYWLAWWEEPARKGDPDVRDQDPVAEADKVRRELEARYQAGLLRRPVSSGAEDGAEREFGG